MNKVFIEPGDLKYECLWRVSWIMNDNEGFQGSHTDGLQAYEEQIIHR